ncbi:MAG: Gfo/Idh/MocA family oxidoreductase [Acetobacteraceae bacterium]|nr:Gfo/Idh/MocA family oxidoreductase [Acetobacteraceae bacterium]
MARFAAVGLDHRHVYDMTAGLLAAGAECVGHDPETTDPRVLAGFRKRFPDVPVVSRERLLDDPSVDFIVLSAVPRDRADIAIAAMRRGKDVMSDKPGVTTVAQLNAMRDAVRETRRLWSVCVGRVASPALQAALRVVRSGELGRLAQVVSLAPHRLNRDLRPDWFFDRPAYGGIVNDIGVHSIDQFLALADMAEAEIESCVIGAYGTAPEGFEDFAEFTLSTSRVRGYCRVDWFTPDGLPTWGDGRLFLVGTEGTLELRKNLDIEGRAGANHMFVAGKTGTRHVDCSVLPVTYFRDFIAAVRSRDFAALPQEQVFTVCRMALAAQASAKRFVAERPK